MSRYVRYPLARRIVRVLVRTSVTPDQVTLVQPLLAAVAGWLISSDERWRLVLAVAIFELRSILDCVDGTLARAKGLRTPWGHAADGLADWLSVLFLYAGIAVHFRAHPPEGPWGAPSATYAILATALAQGAIRSFASDHYKQKYLALFAGSDDAAAGSGPVPAPRSGLFARAEVLIGQLGYLAFEPRRGRGGSPAARGRARAIRHEASSPLFRLIVVLWSVSNGDAFVTLVSLSALAGKLWEGQVFFALVGPLWIGAVIALNGWFARGAVRA